MAIPPIRPLAGDQALDGVLGAEFKLPALDGTEPSSPGPVEGSSFGETLMNAVTKLGDLHTEAAAQSQALATGKADDVTSVAMAVERASLSLQLAATVRNKAVEAYQEIFRMQV
jgi:flagellar hook-basal body complex protein FliE